MGNHLTGIAPSQIFPVEHYLTDVSDYGFDTSLGSTRFFKVARAKYMEGLAVVKVFVIHDPSLPLKLYKDHLEEIKNRLGSSSNCLPFLRSTLSDKAALLFRQYIRNNLYDRISTRPFLNTIEKKWIAFQLLCAINQAHRVKVCHGDIKSENVMVTGWNWVLLTDFASFKPTFLPADNPAEFSFFFDTSRRRTCYIAPERFVEGSTRQSELIDNPESLLGAGSLRKGELTPQMDIFSTGCVIAELFTEGHAPFDLSQLLAYCSGTYGPDIVLQKIEDPSIKELVEHMLQKDPSKRLSSAEDYLLQWKTKAFPDVFYSYLKIFMGEFAGIPILPSDEKIARLKTDMPKIIATLCPTYCTQDSSKDNNSGLIIVLSLVTSCLRTLKFCISKLAGLEILLMIAHHIPDDLILDRIIPYMLYFISDPFPRVRAEAIRTLSQTLALVNSVPRSDANIFPEYILPNLSNVPQDDIVLVRVAYAENIAMLAETALRFLEMVQLDQTLPQDSQADSVQDPNVQYQASYDDELQNLHGMIQQKVVTLLSDTENIVKQTLLENGITRLCVFFGRQKANDVLLSHMITFLNDKNDWHLRGAFFDSIVGVAAYVGWQSSFILKPLIQQGLCDSEEFVICKALTALTSLVELGLLQKPIILNLALEIVPNLCHPNLWVRQGTVGVISVIATKFNIADVHCNIIPLLQPFIKQPVIQVENEAVLLNVLKLPVPRPVYDYVLRSTLIDSLFDLLQDRQLLRNLSRPGHKPSYGQPDSNGLAQLLRKLQSQGMTEDDEDKLLLLKDNVLKQQRAKSSPNDQPPLSPGADSPNIPGVISILALEKLASIQKYHADLLKPAEQRSEVSEKAARKAKKRISNVEPIMMNEEWKSMFGTSEPLKTSKPPAQPSSPIHPAQDALTSLNPTPATKPGRQAPLGLAHRGLSTLGPISMSQLQAAAEGVPEKKPLAPQQEKRPPPFQTLVATCKLELSRLVSQKREQYAADMTRKTLIEEAALEAKIPPSSWKPKGLLVAHLHEHKAAVNRIQLSQDHAFFATCSNDGTVKVWDTSRLLGKSNTNRSRQTYNRQPGRIKALTFCQSSHSIASASDDGSIHVIRIEAGAPRFSLLHRTNLDLQEEGFAVDITHFDTGAQSVVTYATVQGYLVGWDLRAPGIAWRLRNEPKHGLITSFAVDPNQCWMAVGTSNGAHTCWDLRFHLPITTVHHPTASQVRRISLHPNHPSWIISAVQGNNEVSMWDMETGARQFTLWASPSPPLSQTQTSNHAVHGLYCIPSNEHSPSFLTAGSDQRLRYWSLTNPENSGIVAGSVNDPSTQPAVTYRRRLIDGTEVIVETYDKHHSSPNVTETGRQGPEQVSVGHRNVITDLGVFLIPPNTNTAAVVTGSQDGVLKIWK